MKYSVLFLLGMFALTSCEMAPCLTKDAFVSSSESTYKKFETNQDDMTDAQWKSMDNQYKKFLEDCYPNFKEDMTNSELKDFWLKTSKYFIKRAYKGPEVDKEIERLFEQHFEVYIEQMGNKFSEQFKDMLDVNMDETIDKVFDFFESWGKDKK